MFFLFNGQITSGQNIQLDIYSPFLHQGQGITTTMLYHDGKILWYDDHLELLVQDAAALNYEIKTAHFSQDLILSLLEKNQLIDTTAMIKAVCLKDVVGCLHLVLAHPYLFPDIETHAALHPEPLLSRFNKFHTICQARQVYWLEYYGEKFGTDQVLFVNAKGRIIQAHGANVIAVWNRNLYYVYPRQNFTPTIIQQKIIKSASKLGLKKLIDKGNGLSLDLMQRADEVLLISDTFIAQTVMSITRHTGTVIHTSQKSIKSMGQSFALQLRNHFLQNT